MNRASRAQAAGRKSPPVSGKKYRFLRAGVISLILIYLFVPLAQCQFICLFLLFIIAGSKLYSWYLAKNIRVTRQDSELRSFRYEWIRVELKVENCGFLPAFMLTITDSSAALSVSKDRKKLCTLRPRTWTMLAWQGHCTERGSFMLGPAIIRGADPLGLFPFELSAPETSNLFVYPVFCSISVKSLGGIPLGNMVSTDPLFEDITRRRSLRPYQKGDEPRRISWKASARLSTAPLGTNGGTFMVNEYEATASYPTMIFLNVNQNEYPARRRREIIERVIEAAAALCLKVSHDRQELGIIIYTSNSEDGLSIIAPAPFTLVPILERLALLSWDKTDASTETTTGSGTEAGDLHGSAKVMLDQGKYLPYGTRYFYVGADLGDEAYIGLNSLKRHHLTLEYLIIDERAMPSLVPGNSRRYQMKESGREIV